MSRGVGYRLFAEAVAGEERGKWVLIGLHYQHRSWMDDEIHKLTRLGIKAKIEEYETEYDDR